MLDKLLQYKGPYGEQKNPVSDGFVDYEPLRVRSAAYNYKIIEHLHTDLIQIIIITEGGGILLSEGKKIPLESPCVLVIPSERLHGFAFQSSVKGDVFTIAEHFFDQAISSNTGLFSKFNQLAYIPLDNGGKINLSLIEIKNKMLYEIALSDRATELSLSLLLQLFLINLHRSLKSDEVTISPSDNRALQYFHQFKKLIKRHGHERKQVLFYAKEIKLSTVHLNRVCQMVSQKNALQIIHDYIIQEAKKYLTGTAYSVAEIAYFLGFKDPAHFSKFFKKKEGMAPGQLRKALKDTYIN